MILPFYISCVWRWNLGSGLLAAGFGAPIGRAIGCQTCCSSHFQPPLTSLQASSLPHQKTFFFFFNSLPFSGATLWVADQPAEWTCMIRGLLYFLASFLPSPSFLLSHILLKSEHGQGRRKVYICILLYFSTQKCLFLYNWRPNFWSALFKTFKAVHYWCF